MNLDKFKLSGLRVLLVNMPLRESALPNCAPLGPALLASILRNQGASVSIIDLNAYRITDRTASARGLKNGRHLNYEEVEQLFWKHLGVHGAPHLVGISGKITTLKWQEWAAKFIRKLLPDTLLVSGGGLATEFRDGLFQWIPELDAVAIGEGDESILQIAKDALSIKNFGRKSAVATGKVRNSKHTFSIDRLRIVYEGVRPSDLDSIPFPSWDLLESDINGFPVLEHYIKNPIWGGNANNSSATPWEMGRSLNTVSSRGCPFACKYCFRGGQGGRNYGVRSAGSIIDEVLWMSNKWKIDFCAFLDDNFLVNKERIKALADPLGDICKEKNIRWGTHGRLDEAADSDRMENMSRAGCSYVGFGAESASPRVLELMGKGGQMMARGTEKVNGYNLPKTMLEGFRKTFSAGIHGNLTWITAYPGSTLEDEKATATFIEWQKELTGKPDAVNQKSFVAQAYPGTEMFKNPKVRKRLHDGFGLSFNKFNQPIVDDALHQYTLELDDATKVLQDKNGRPVFYGDMDEDTFLRVRELADKGDMVGILNL